MSENTNSVFTVTGVIWHGSIKMVHSVVWFDQMSSEHHTNRRQAVLGRDQKIPNLLNEKRVNRIQVIQD